MAISEGRSQRGPKLQESGREGGGNSAVRGLECAITPTFPYETTDTGIESAYLPPCRYSRCFGRKRYEDLRGVIAKKIYRMSVND